jgi:hypothetical protein
MVLLVLADSSRWEMSFPFVVNRVGPELVRGEPGTRVKTNRAASAFDSL